MNTNQTTPALLASRAKSGYESGYSLFWHKKEHLRDAAARAVLDFVGDRNYPELAVYWEAFARGAQDSIHRPKERNFADAHIKARLENCPMVALYEEEIYEVRLVVLHASAYDRLARLAMGLRMIAGDDGSAESGPDFWYEGNRAGQIATYAENDRMQPRAVWRGRRGRTAVYTRPAHAVQIAAELAQIAQPVPF